MRSAASSNLYAKVHVIFTVCVADKIDGEQQSDEALAFVEYYTVKAPSNSKEAAQNLTMRHLVWETKSVQNGKRHSSQPSYGVVAVDNILQRACICPHFAL